MRTFTFVSIILASLVLAEAAEDMKRGLSEKQFDQLIQASNLLDRLSKASPPTYFEVDDYIQENYDKTNTWYAFIVEGVMLCFVSVVGCICNLMAIVVVTRSFNSNLDEEMDLPEAVRRKNKDIKLILVSLAVADVVYLVSGLAIFGLPSTSEWFRQFAYPYVLPKLYAVAHMAHVASVFLTLVVTLERFYSICYPLQTPKYRQYYVLAVFIFTIVYNIPRFYEVKFVEPKDNNTLPEVVPSDLRNNWIYVTFYMFWSRLILVEIIPYALIIGMNYFIWKKIKSLASVARNQRRTSMACIELDEEPELTEARPASTEAPLSEDELQLARTLFMVVMVFIVCQSFKIIPDVYEIIWCSQSYKTQGSCMSMPFIEMVIDTSHLMLAVNSSANFFIYIWYRGRFRQSIIDLVKTRYSPNQNGRRETAYEMVPIGGDIGPKTLQNSIPGGREAERDIREVDFQQGIYEVVEIQSCPTMRDTIKPLA